MSSPSFQAPRSAMGLEKFSPANELHQGFDWSFPAERNHSARHDVPKRFNSAASSRKHEEAPAQWTNASSVLPHAPAHPMHMQEEAWNTNMWTPPPTGPAMSASSEQMCLMDLAKENVLLKRQLHDASVQIHRLRDVLHCGASYSPRPMKKEDKKQKANQARFWSEDEHKRFVEAIRRFGPKDVKAISKAVRTRTPVQVRTHAQKYFLKIARDRKKQQHSDSTTDGTDCSRSTSSYPFCSAEMPEDDDDADEAAVAAATAACGEEGTSAAAAAAFVAASSAEHGKFGGAMDVDQGLHLGSSMLKDGSTQPEVGRYMDACGAESDPMLADPALVLCGHEAN